MELFQKIEALTGQKMEKFEAEQDAALILLDGVNEAQRVATMQVYLDQKHHLQPQSNDCLMILQELPM